MEHFSHSGILMIGSHQEEFGWVLGRVSLFYLLQHIH